MSVRRTDRLATILERVARTGSLAVGVLARDLDASEATIRRDLAVLEEQSLLRRTHGGASSQDVATELPVHYRDGRERAAKQRIAEACLDGLNSGITIMGVYGISATGCKPPMSGCRWRAPPTSPPD